MTEIIGFECEKTGGHAGQRDDVRRYNLAGRNCAFYGVCQYRIGSDVEADQSGELGVEWFEQAYGLGEGAVCGRRERSVDCPFIDREVQKTLILHRFFEFRTLVSGNYADLGYCANERVGRQKFAG